MPVLLNITANELEKLGGDGIVYERASTDRLRRTNAFLRKGFENACRTWQPEGVRRRLFLASRIPCVPKRSTDGIDVIFSHLLFPAGTDSRIPIAPIHAVPPVWDCCHPILFLLAVSLVLRGHAGLSPVRCAGVSVVYGGRRISLAGHSAARGRVPTERRLQSLAALAPGARTIIHMSLECGVAR
jgi:hypothetical protein